MEKLRKALYVTLSVIAILVAIASVLSVFRNTENRFLKMLDFPRIQFFLTSVVGLLLFVVSTKRWRWYDYGLIMGLLAGIFVHSSYLIYYTNIVSPAVPGIEEGTYSNADRISILLVNVKMSNRKAQPLLQLIEDKDPDIILAMEVDKWWDRQLEPIEMDYPYAQETINSVAYGMTLYSKQPLQEVQVNYLQNEKVPSFECTIQFKNKRKAVLYSMHPVPPTHYEDLPDNDGQQEVAMKRLGEKIEKGHLPAIVAGDINDVVWSATDKLTGTTNLLHDVRVGRGFYNSYHTKNIFMRWPLDHVFVTEEFHLAELGRLPDIGSDHFPIFVTLVLPSGQ